MSDDIAIRSLETPAELAACVELQRETWGRFFTDAVPASILKVARKVGGVAAGAFKDEALIGFVFGISGVRDGNVVHWSDMLAVRPEFQSRGVGRRLKEFQRAEVARIGATEILWTYDPLVARNAHLNFNVFGVRVVDYVRDMYGDDTGSDLHSGLGTDRLIVAWPVPDDALDRMRRRTAAARVDARFADAPVIGEPAQAPPEWPAIDRNDRLRIAVPGDIHAVLRTRPGDARQWRTMNRAAFEAATERGYSVIGFRADTANDRGHYLLSRS